MRRDCWCSTRFIIEFGNETWNGSFRGESMNSTAYPGLANQNFGAARKTPGYLASNFDLVDGLQVHRDNQVSLLLSTVR